jgi:hypothetical protein
MTESRFAAAPKPRTVASGPSRSSAMPNSHVRDGKLPSDLSLPARVVTVDVDGSVYDPWACCGIKGNFRSSATCDHRRHDTLAEIERVARDMDATPVILSWRAGLHAVTGEWAREVGLRPAAIFTPGSPDDIAGACLNTGFFRKSLWGGSQAAYKAAVVATLIARYHVRVVASFEDNATVCAALRRLRVPYVHQVPRIVEVSDHEFTAGYLGAPKPAPHRPTSSYRPSRAHRSTEPTLWDSYRGDDFRDDPYNPHDGWDEPPAGWYANEPDDEETAFLASHGFKVGDEVRVDLGRSSDFGEILGAEDGAVVVMTATSSCIEYLGPARVRRI